jgi:hypothetical protein
MPTSTFSKAQEHGHKKNLGGRPQHPLMETAVSQCLINIQLQGKSKLVAVAAKLKVGTHALRNALQRKKKAIQAAKLSSDASDRVVKLADALNAAQQPRRPPQPDEEAPHQKKKRVSTVNGCPVIEGNQGPRTLAADNTIKYLGKDGTCHVVRLDNEVHRKFDVSNMYLKEQYATAFMEAQRAVHDPADKRSTPEMCRCVRLCVCGRAST